MVEGESTLDLGALILEHIGRYRISFLPVMERVYGGLGNVKGTVQKLQKAGLITARGRDAGYGSLLGGYTAYQVTAKGARQAGHTEKRAKELNENGLEISFRVLWLCCMGTPRYRQLEEMHLKQLFGHPLKSKFCPYAMEMDGENRVYRIRLLGQDSKDDHALRETREDLMECGKLPILKEFCEHGRYGNLLVVSKPERRRRLEERINKQGLKTLGHVRVALVPDLAEIKGAFGDR